MRLRDDRWRAAGPEKFTFSKPDERLAIQRYTAWQARKAGKAGAIDAYLIERHSDVIYEHVNWTAGHGGGMHIWVANEGGRGLRVARRNLDALPLAFYLL